MKFKFFLKKDEDLSIHELKGNIEEYKGVTIWITFILTLLTIFITYSGGMRDKENDVYHSVKKSSLQSEILQKERTLDKLNKSNFTLSGGTLQIKNGSDSIEEFNLKKIFYERKLEEINDNTANPNNKDDYNENTIITYIKNDIEKEIDKLKIKESDIPIDHWINIKSLEDEDQRLLLIVIIIGYLIPLYFIHKTKKWTILLSEKEYLVK
ncbi:MAG: hypothetical protein PHQ95_04780 [Candidatus Gracilibacteria bacterium]|nr:hypothetical protein [Candidatus Gracilibacteria bacterium]